MSTKCKYDLCVLKSLWLRGGFFQKTLGYCLKSTRRLINVYKLIFLLLNRFFVITISSANFGLSIILQSDFLWKSFSVISISIVKRKIYPNISWMIYTGFQRRDKIHHTLNHFARNPTVRRYLECDEITYKNICTFYQIFKRKNIRKRGTARKKSFYF